MSHPLSLPAALAAAAALCACESVSFSINNIDPAGIAAYYRPSLVEVVTYEELGDRPYLVVGQVRGLSLQERELDLPANEADARTELRKNAVRAGGNALVIHKCISVSGGPGSAVRSSVTCYGDALVIEDE